MGSRKVPLGNNWNLQVQGVAVGSIRPTRLLRVRARISGRNVTSVAAIALSSNVAAPGPTTRARAAGSGTVGVQIA